MGRAPTEGAAPSGMASRGRPLEAGDRSGRARRVACGAGANDDDEVEAGRAPPWEWEW